MVALAAEWVRINAAYDEMAVALFEADPDADLPCWPRLDELQDAITDMMPRTLDGLIAKPSGPALNRAAVTVGRARIAAPDAPRP